MFLNEILKCYILTNGIVQSLKQLTLFIYSLHAVLSFNMFKKYIGFYKKGFALVKGNGILFLVCLFFSLGSQVDKIAVAIGIAKNPFIAIVAFIIGLFSLGSFFITIKTLSDALEKQKVTLALIEHNYKATFIKSIKMATISVAFSIIWFGLQSFLKNSIIPLNLTFLPRLILVLLFPIFSYFEIYFIVKNISMVDSLLKSIHFYMKHIAFISISILFGLLNWIIQSTNPLGIMKSPFYYIYGIIMIFAGLVISASALLYFKDKEVKLEEIKN